MPRLELFPFRYRDTRTGKWIRARYRAERHEIAARYAEFEITGLAEIRAQGRHAVLSPVLLDEGVLHLASRAK